VGLQKEPISFSHPEFHKREATLMSSRNATRQDFEQVIYCMKEGVIDPSLYISHRIPFSRVSDEFEALLDPDQHVIKAMIEMD
jgi:threonine dehydrogenase-like Zn-dependent dehydrogenase